MFAISSGSGRRNSIQLLFLISTSVILLGFSSWLTNINASTAASPDVVRHLDRPQTIMWTWKKSDTEKLDKERLYNAFPSSLRQDVEKVITVLPFDKNVLLCDGQIHNIESLIHPDEQLVILDEELLKIPRRVYFNEPRIGTEKVLTNLQKAILNCIYLRHHNGFIRQKRLEYLLDTTAYLVVPYTLQLLGEYVIEIVEVLDRHVNESNADNYTKFINENQKYWQQTESRMISYWNEYYRPKYPKLKDYIGKKIVDRIKANAQHVVWQNAG